MLQSFFKINDMWYKQLNRLIDDQSYAIRKRRISVFENYLFFVTEISYNKNSQYHNNRAPI